MIRLSVVGTEAGRTEGGAGETQPGFLIFAGGIFSISYKSNDNQ